MSKLDAIVLINNDMLSSIGCPKSGIGTDVGVKIESLRIRYQQYGRYEVTGPHDRRSGAILFPAPIAPKERHKPAAKRTVSNSRRWIEHMLYGKNDGMHKE